MTTERASRRRFLQASGVAAVTALAGCGGGGGGDEGPSVDAAYTYTLTSEKSSHTGDVQISVGETILWTADGGNHFVRKEDAPEGSSWQPPVGSPISGSDTHSHTFEVAGTYEWSCDYHGGPFTFEVTE